MSIEWIRFIIGLVFIAVGLLIFVLELLGVFHFKFVLNRMHAAALGDTLGLGSLLIGLMIFSGINFTTAKLMLVTIFLWCSSPVSSHLIARLEVMTNASLEKDCEVPQQLKESIAAGDENTMQRLEDFVDLDKEEN